MPLDELNGWFYWVIFLIFHYNWSFSTLIYTFKQTNVVRCSSIVLNTVQYSHMKLSSRLTFFLLICHKYCIYTKLYHRVYVLYLNCGVVMVWIVKAIYFVARHSTFHELRIWPNLVFCIQPHVVNIHLLWISIQHQCEYGLPFVALTISYSEIDKRGALDVSDWWRPFSRDVHVVSQCMCKMHAFTQCTQTAVMHASVYTPFYTLLAARFYVL